MPNAVNCLPKRVTSPKPKTFLLVKSSLKLGTLSFITLPKLIATLLIETFWVLNDKVPLPKDWLKAIIFAVPVALSFFKLTVRFGIVKVKKPAKLSRTFLRLTLFWVTSNIMPARVFPKTEIVPKPLPLPDFISILRASTSILNRLPKLRSKFLKVVLVGVILNSTFAISLSIISR